MASEDPGDFADLNPAFASRLNAFKTALDKQGIEYGVISGYRSPEYQNRMYQNHLAQQAGRPLPYPNDEAPKVVAPAWGSFHNYGLAADFSGPNLDRIRALAPQFGLTGIGSSDPGHIQMGGGNLNQVLAANQIAQGWRPAQGGTAVAAAGTAPAPAAPQGGGSGPYLSQRDQHIQFIRDYANKIGLNPDLALGIANAEGLNAWSAKNPAAGSYVDRDAQGRPFSYGDFQLNTRAGMGVDARRAGVDPSDPNQWQAADRFALDRMKAGGVGPWSDPFARQYARTGVAPPFTAGTTLNTAGDPAIGSQTGSPSGGSWMAAGGPSATPAPGQPGQPQGTSQGTLPGFTPGSPAANSMQAAMKTLGGGGGQGGAPGGGGDYGGGEDRPPPLPPIAPAPPASGGSMMMGPGGQNTLGRNEAQQGLPSLLAAQLGLGRPSMPMASTVGSPVKIEPGQVSGMGAGLPGTTLNSPSQLQLALMTGAINPYDLYGGGMLGGQTGGGYGQ